MKTLGFTRLQALLELVFWWELCLAIEQAASLLNQRRGAKTGFAALVSHQQAAAEAGQAANGSNLPQPLPGGGVEVMQSLFLHRSAAPTELVACSVAGESSPRDTGHRNRAIAYSVVVPRVCLRR